MEDYYRPLYCAALTGDWEAAKRFLKTDSNAVTARITLFWMTVLHVAAGEGHSRFVENLVSIMTEEEVEMRDMNGCTALHYAASAGSLKAAMALVKRNRRLTNIVNSDGWTPLLSAVFHGFENKDLVWYLSMVTTNEEPGRPFTGPNAGPLTFCLASAGYQGKNNDVSNHTFTMINSSNICFPQVLNGLSFR